MNLVRAVACVLVLLVTGGVAGAQTPAPSVETQQPAIEFDPVAVDTEYRIRPGDVLTIKFFYNPELNETVPVRPDGRISLELIDEIRAAGRTVSEFKSELTSLYSATLKQPEVAVIVKTIAPRRVYVGGEVGTPGLMEVTGRLTLVQALFQGGGLR